MIKKDLNYDIAKEKTLILVNGDTTIFYPDLVARVKEFSKADIINYKELDIRPERKATRFKNVVNSLKSFASASNTPVIYFGGYFQHKDLIIKRIPKFLQKGQPQTPNEITFNRIVRTHPDPDNLELVTFLEFYIFHPSGRVDSIIKGFGKNTYYAIKDDVNLNLGETERLNFFKRQLMRHFSFL